MFRFDNRKNYPEGGMLLGTCGPKYGPAVFQAEISIIKWKIQHRHGSKTLGKHS